MPKVATDKKTGIKKSANTKYVFVVGGVMSGVGKGITASSIATILQARDLKVTAIKIDPYINVDAGTMNPTEHGEVFVLKDGLETDQDMGNYERFLNQDLPSINYMTTGSVYLSVIHKERNLEYKGKNVEVVPDIPLEVIRRIKRAGEEAKADVVLVEVGGTVGEYQNILFLEAIRMMKSETPEDVVTVMVSYLPVPSSVGEMKTKYNTKLEEEKKINKDDKLNDITSLTEPISQSVRERLIKADPTFKQLLLNYDKSEFKIITIKNPFSFNITDLKTKVDSAKDEIDKLEERFKDLPEFKALRKLINIGVLITRIYHYKRVNAAKQELGIVPEDLNKPEFTFYDKTVEGFREFYFPTRQYLNEGINDIFVKDDEVDIFDLKDLFDGKIKDDDKLKKINQPQGIDQINFQSKTSSDPKFEISLQLNVFGGVVTNNNRDAVKCAFLDSNIPASFSQYVYELPVQEYYDLTEIIEKINKNMENKEKTDKKQKETKQKQAQQQSQQKQAQQAQQAQQTQQTQESSKAPPPAAEQVEQIKTISNEDYENELNRLYAAADKKIVEAYTKKGGGIDDIVKALSDSKSSKIKDYFSFIKTIENRPPTEMAPGQKNKTNRDYFKTMHREAIETVGNVLSDIKDTLTGDTAATLPADKKTKLEFKQVLFKVVEDMLKKSETEMKKKLNLSGGKRTKRIKLRKSRRTRRNR